MQGLCYSFYDILAGNFEVKAVTDLILNSLGHVNRGSDLQWAVLILNK